MRILLVTQYWHPENGVPQRRWSWLSGVLRDAGHEVFVIAPPPRSSLVKKLSFQRAKETLALSIDNDRAERIYRSYRPRSGNSISEKMAEQLLVAAGQIVIGRRVLRDVHPDLVVGTVPAIPTAIVAFLLAKLGRIGYVIDLRDAWPDLLRQADRWNAGLGKKSVREMIANLGPLQLVSKLTEVALNLVLRNSSAIIVTSANLQKNLANRRSLRKCRKHPRIALVRNVFPSENSVQKEVKNSAEQGVLSLNVLYAGTIGRAQNLLNALMAAKLAEESGVRLSLIFVGAGASKDHLKKQATELGVDAKFVNQQPPGELDRFYTWADTALVHLTEWEPLERTVPSKTYELMEVGIHISAVVEGEAAALVEELKAGDVVEPGNPEQLASLWTELARNRNRLSTGDTGRKWVEEQRKVVAPSILLRTIDEVGSSKA